MKIIPNYAVIYQRDDFSQCLGVFESSYEAIGNSYVYISEIKDDDFLNVDKINMSTLYNLEGDTGWGIEFEIFYKDRMETQKEYIFIYDNTYNVESEKMNDE